MNGVMNNKKDLTPSKTNNLAGTGSGWPKRNGHTIKTEINDSITSLNQIINRTINL